MTDKKILEREIKVCTDYLWEGISLEDLKEEVDCLIKSHGPASMFMLDSLYSGALITYSSEETDLELAKRIEREEDRENQRVLSNHKKLAKYRKLENELRNKGLL